jgi:hypothetical protein
MRIPIRECIRARAEPRFFFNPPQCKEAMNKPARKSKTSIPNQNITRIESPGIEGRSPVKGWEVRIYRRGQRFNQFFSDSAHGGKTKALELARKVRDKMEKRLKPWSRRELAKRLTARNTSGHRGVRLRRTNVNVGTKSYVYEHVEASWSPEPGKVVKQSFSVEKLGLDKAWQMAVEARDKAVSRIKG